MKTMKIDKNVNDDNPIPQSGTAFDELVLATVKPKSKRKLLVKWKLSLMQM